MEYLQENRLHPKFNLDSKNIARVAGDIAERKNKSKVLVFECKKIRRKDKELKGYQLGVLILKPNRNNAR